MTREEAIIAMKQGKKVTHSRFTSDEWMTMEKGEIVTEDGCRHCPNEFWSFRQLPYWNHYYSIFK